MDLNLLMLFASVLWVAYNRGIDIDDDENVKDILVDLTADMIHLTDEQLQIELDGFRYYEKVFKDLFKA